MSQSVEQLVQIEMHQAPHVQLIPFPLIILQYMLLLVITGYYWLYAPLTCLRLVMPIPTKTT
jgi:hypothetical protein